MSKLEFGMSGCDAVFTYGRLCVVAAEFVLPSLIEVAARVKLPGIECTPAFYNHNPVNGVGEERMGVFSENPVALLSAHQYEEVAKVMTLGIVPPPDLTSVMGAVFSEQKRPPCMGFVEEVHNWMSLSMVPQYDYCKARTSNLERDWSTSLYMNFLQAYYGGDPHDYLEKARKRFGLS